MVKQVLKDWQRPLVDILLSIRTPTTIHINYFLYGHHTEKIKRLFLSCSPTQLPNFQLNLLHIHLWSLAVQRQRGDSAQLAKMGPQFWALLLPHRSLGFLVLVHEDKLYPPEPLTVGTARVQQLTRRGQHKHSPSATNLEFKLLQVCRCFARRRESQAQVNQDQDLALQRPNDHIYRLRGLFRSVQVPMDRREQQVRPYRLAQQSGNCLQDPLLLTAADEHHDPDLLSAND